MIVHENAHQWYGDSVAVAHWRDVMQDFQRYTESVAHRSLKGFFDAWVYGTGKPADQYLFPGGLKPAA